MKRKELYIYIVILTAANIGLMKGYFCWPLMFISEQVQAGQWWRIFTHPFLHSSFYHLFLDGAAFFILYSQIQQKSIRKKTLYVIGCGLGSLTAATIAMPFLDSVGYCGLSGIDHGLMVISGLEMLKNKSLRSIGIAMLIIIVIKCILETISGNFVFDFLHNGMIGSPVAAAHLGGAIAAVLTYWLIGEYTKHCSNSHQISLSSI
ncbi:MAG: rhombosortase [Sedimentisphaeraceae bacterium JB056]